MRLAAELTASLGANQLVGMSIAGSVIALACMQTLIQAHGVVPAGPHTGPASATGHAMHRKPRTANMSAMKGAPTNRHSRCVAHGAAGPRVSATSAATAAAPLSCSRSSPCIRQQWRNYSPRPCVPKRREKQQGKQRLPAQRAIPGVACNVQVALRDRYWRRQSSLSSSPESHHALCLAA